MINRRAQADFALHWRLLIGALLRAGLLCIALLCCLPLQAQEAIALYQEAQEISDSALLPQIDGKTGRCDLEHAPALREFITLQAGTLAEAPPIVASEIKLAFDSQFLLCRPACV